MFDFDARTRPAAAPTAAAAAPPLIDVQDVGFAYGDKPVLHNVSFRLARRECLAFIGPSGCGKSTMLKCLNRMHDDVRGARMTGRILFDGGDVNAPEVDPPIHRRRFGWVAQKPNPFAWSIRDNIAYGARLHGVVPEAEMDAHVEGCLRAAHLWDEVEDRLGMSGLDLSGGQQQRLCIARALSTRPEVLLMDEPCGSIDPVATAKVEELVVRLKREVAIVIVTHNMEQARRVADRVAFFHLGRLKEIGSVERVFAAPEQADCRAYLSGRFG